MPLRGAEPCDTSFDIGRNRRHQRQDEAPDAMTSARPDGDDEVVLGNRTMTGDRLRASRFGKALVFGLAALASGCSGALEIPLPPIPSLPSNAPEFPGSSTSVYTRIARGANACWFGPRGALDRTYIWHARAEPESKGGMAEILVHERVDKNQRGLKSFSVTIAPRGEGAAVVAESLKMPAILGQRMTADAYRWARGNVGCVEGDSSWEPLTAEQSATPAPAGKKKVKTAAKPPAKGAPATTGSIKPRAAPAPSAKTP